jgi:hypothetical protein
MSQYGQGAAEGALLSRMLILQLLIELVEAIIVKRPVPLGPGVLLNVAAVVCKDYIPREMASGMHMESSAPAMPSAEANRLDGDWARILMPLIG